MNPTTFYVVNAWNPRTSSWLGSELVQGPPVSRVRALLGGKWTKTSGNLLEDMAAAYWNADNGRKVWVVRMPNGMTRESATRVMAAG